MGCASSKDDKADASPSDVNPAVGGSPAHKGPTTHTGYHSDVEAGQKHAFTEQLVTNNMHQIGEIYDLSHSTTLGRGACGSVSTVTHKATGAMYAMKTVSMEGMAAHTMAELRQEIAVQKMLDHPNIVRPRPAPAPTPPPLHRVAHLAARRSPLLPPCPPPAAR